MKSSRLSYFLICLLLLITIIVAGCTSNTKETPAPKIERDIVTIGLTSDIFGIYPHMSTYESTTLNVESNIFNGLVEFDGNYKLRPALAESWSNPDDLTWRFYLRKGVKFHNGKDFNAYDVKFTFDYTLSEEADSVLKDLISSIDSVTVINDYEVEIKTKEPNPILLNKITDVYIIPSTYKEIPAEQWPVGTGAYKLKEYVPNDHILLERFDGYWRQPAPIKTVLYKIIPDHDERLTALIQNKIDIAENILPTTYANRKDYENIDIISTPSIMVVYLGFDVREYDSYGFPGEKNPTSDVRVRKAIYYALDENEIISKYLSGVVEPATQLLSPNIFGYNPNIKRLPYDLDEAKKLMKEAGYENGFNITLDCPTDGYINDEEICNEIVEQLAKINIKVTVNAQPTEIHYPKMDAHESSFFFLGWAAETADGGEIFDYLMHSVNSTTGTGVYNTGYYSNPEVDKAGEQSAKIVNPTERLKIMQNGFQIAMDDAAWIPLHIENNIYGIQKDLALKPRVDLRIYLEEIQIKK